MVFQYQRVSGDEQVDGGASGHVGRLCLIVGPSGAGKDRLLSAARAQLSGRGDIIFARREITRPANAGSEDHIAVSAGDFSEREAQGHYFLSWRAHGLGYGISADIAGHLLAGRDVVVNVSRGVLTAARLKYPEVRVGLITAPESVLAERLSIRGREAADDIALRIAQAGKPLDQPADAVISNEGAFEHALHDFLAFLTEPRRQAAQAS